jgi:hypothetical protein
MRKRKPELVSNMQIGVSSQTVVSFPTGNSRIAVGLPLFAVYDLFDDICHRIIVGLQCFTKRGKTYGRIIRRGFKHRDSGNENSDQSIGTQTVAACISKAVQVRSPQALRYQVIWSLRLDDPAVGVDARRPGWI